MNFYDSDKLSAYEAKQEAQKIAFAPFVFQATKAIRDLKILENIDNCGQEGMCFDELFQRMNLSRYGLRVLIEAGLGIGLFILKNQKYSLTKLGHFILYDKMTQVNMDFVHDVNYQGFFYLKESIEEGKPIGLKSLDCESKTIYQALSTLPQKVKESWFNFDHFYSDNAFDQSLPLVLSPNSKKILDIGANTGKWAIKCASFNQDVRITMCDLQGQLNVALKNIENLGLSYRIDGYPIDILDINTQLPSGYDVIWMSQFLDCFSEDEIVSILRKVKSVLNSNDRVYILETYWDRQKYENASFCLQQTSLYFACMANGNSQMYHSDLMHQCIKKAGLSIEKEYDHIGISHTLTICK